eukprot:679392-Pelagomonas_calceolata.AAC.1
MPREKGPERDYVTLVQPEGTDGVKCKLCEQCFMEVPRASGCTSCKPLAVGCPSVAEDKLGPVKKVMQLEQDSRSKERAAQDSSTGQRASASAAAPARKQKTLTDCMRKTTKADMGTDGLSRPPQKFSPASFITHSKQPTSASTT